MNVRSISVALILTSFSGSLAYGQGFTERGAVVGGLAGALTGAAIGKHNKETAAGALIGGAVGVAAGAALGSARDADVARTRAQYRHQAELQLSRAVSTQDVVEMTQNGLNDGVIISHVQQNGVQRRLEVSDVIALHQQGVSEPVITAMQRARQANVYQPVEVVRPAPVIIEEHYYRPRPVYYCPPPPPYYHHHHHHHQSYLQFRF